jgi:hypothetical protein
MAEQSCWESVKVQGEELVGKVKEIVREGNVRRVVIEHKGRSLAEFPLTIGVVGALAAPTLAAIGALAALLTECTIQVEKAEEARPAGRARPRRGKAVRGARSAR